MRTSYEERFILAVMAVSKERALAAQDAFVKFAETPAEEALALQPIQGMADHFYIVTRHDDYLVIRRDPAEVYTAIDVGPYSLIHERWEKSRRP